MHLHVCELEKQTRPHGCVFLSRDQECTLENQNSIPSFDAQWNDPRILAYSARYGAGAGTGNRSASASR